MSSDSSSSDESCAPQRPTKSISREFVRLKEISNCIPRGRLWGNMSREGSVKELAFLPSWNEKKMEEVNLKGFPALRGAGMTRLVEYHLNS